ncbi:hypothetical protein CPB85DRAFT_563322 [Mucidula mucida]|nr:hypothetical protein CPB85DRAFT_563322 [Mucidula mucida]
MILRSFVALPAYSAHVVASDSSIIDKFHHDLAVHELGVTRNLWKLSSDFGRYKSHHNPVLILELPVESEIRVHKGLTLHL